MKRFLSIIITVIMVMGILPVAAFASDGEETVYSLGSYERSYTDAFWIYDHPHRFVPAADGVVTVEVTSVTSDVEPAFVVDCLSSIDGWSGEVYTPAPGSVELPVSAGVTYDLYVYPAEIVEGIGTCIAGTVSYTITANVECNSSGGTEPDPEPEPSVCEHSWTDATCTAPKTCALCGETEGEKLGHDYVDAVCTRCGMEKGADVAYVESDGVQTRYDDLQDALDAAVSADKVVLLDDISGEKTYTIGVQKNIGIYLNGHKIENTGTGNALAIEGSNVSIYDDGTIHSGGVAIALVNGANLNIMDGITVSCPADDTGNVFSIDDISSVEIFGIGGRYYKDPVAAGASIPDNCVVSGSDDNYTIEYYVPADGDTVVIGDYTYTYVENPILGGISGWNPVVNDKTKTEYGAIEYAVKGHHVTMLNRTFDGCVNMTVSPEIPYGVHVMYNTYKNCAALESAPAIPGLVVTMYNTFKNCTGLTVGADIPPSVTNMTYCYVGCTKLVEVTIPAQVTDFVGVCKNSGVQVITIGLGINKIDDYAFEGCDDLVTLDFNGTLYDWFRLDKGLGNSPLDGIVTYFCASANETTVHTDGLHAVFCDLPITDLKDIFVAPGIHTTYREVANNRIYRATVAKIGNGGFYKYTLPAEGLYTLLVRTQNNELTFVYFDVVLEARDPQVTEGADGITVTDLTDVKVVRFAKGSYATEGEVKRGEAARNFTQSAVKGADSFTIPANMYEKGTTYTLAIHYNDGKVVMREITTERAESVVTTLDELLAALDAGGSVKLGSDIEMETYYLVYNTVSIDLNGHTLTTAGNGFLVYEGGNLTVCNGTVTPVTILNNGGTVNVYNCSLTDEANAVYNRAGIFTVKDSTLYGVACADSGEIRLEGTIVFESGYGHKVYTGIYANGGTVTCTFDPSGNIFGGTVTDNGDGTWTVS